MIRGRHHFRATHLEDGNPIFTHFRPPRRYIIRIELRRGRRRAGRIRKLREKKGSNGQACFSRRECEPCHANNQGRTGSDHPNVDRVPMLMQHARYAPAGRHCKPFRRSLLSVPGPAFPPLLPPRWGCVESGQKNQRAESQPDELERIHCSMCDGEIACGLIHQATRALDFTHLGPNRFFFFPPTSSAALMLALSCIKHPVAVSGCFLWELIAPVQAKSAALLPLP